PRGSEYACYDPPRDQIVVAEGSRVYALSLGTSPTWSALGDFTWRWFSGYYFYGAGRLSVYGGLVALTPAHTGWFNDVQSLDLATLTFQEMAPPVNAPIGGAGASFVYDPVSQSAWAFGGTAGDTVHAETWRTPLGDRAAWQRVAVGETAPSPRSF